MRNMELIPMYLVAKRHYGEIEEALNMGCDIRYICEKIRAKCIERGEWNENWAPHWILKMYRMIETQKMADEVMNSE